MAAIPTAAKPSMSWRRCAACAPVKYDEGEAAVARAELVRPIPDDVTGPGPHDRAVTADLRAALQTLLE